MAVGIYKQTAEDVMTRHVVSLRTNDTIRHALMLMAENDLSAIPVVDPEGKCVGIISQHDVVAEARARDVEDSQRPTPTAADMLYGGVALEELTNETVDQIMSGELVSVRSTDAVVAVADRMLERGIHHIPVVSEDNSLLGIVSTMDILAGLRTRDATSEHQKAQLPWLLG